MIALNLTANGNEQTVLKEYLQNNASETLAEKINNGVRILKDGTPLLSKKSLDSFMKYACDEAKKQAEKGANSACIHSDTVFNWAIHYFEEDSIEGVLFNIDGTKFKPPKPKYEPKTSSTPVVPPKPQPKPQLSLFDLMESKENEILIEESKDIANEENDDEDSFTEEEQQEIMQEIFRQEAEENDQKLQVKLEPPKGSPLYQRYSNLQQQFPDSIIAMRLGDFYEVFGGSATLLARELDLTLTGRDCGLESRVPMVGFPYHAAENYIRKISEKHKIVIAESTDNYKVCNVIEQSTEVDYDLETGEVLTEEEMRKFDGDIEEPKELLTNSSVEKPAVIVTNTTSDNKIFNKLSELLGNILIAR